MDLITRYDRALILSYLRDPADIVRARGVCREWRALVAEPQIDGTPLSRTITKVANHILYLACEANYLSLAKYAIARGATNINDCLIIADKNNHTDLAKFMIECGANSWQRMHRAFYYNNRELIDLVYANSKEPLPEWLYNACEGGHIELVRELEVYSADWWEVAFYYACLGGHMEMINMLIAEHTPTKWGNGLQGACEGGHFEIARMLIARGSNNFNLALYHACLFGSVEIAEYLISLGARSFDLSLDAASINGNVELVKLLIKHGSTNYANAFNNACLCAHVELARLLLPNMNVSALSNGFVSACKSGSFEIVRMIYSRIPDNFYTYANQGLRSTNKDIVNFAIEHGADNWEGALLFACSTGDPEYAKLALKNGAVGVNGGLQNASCEGCRELVDLMLEHGATHINLAIYNARMSGYDAIAEYLIARYKHDIVVCLVGE